MRRQFSKHSLLQASALLIGTLMTAAAVAQSSNPFQVFKNALNKATQSLNTSTQKPAAPAQTPAQTLAQTPQQSQAPSPQAPSSPLASAPVAASGGTAAPWTPPTDTPTASVGPLDPAQLPDVGGVHIGNPSTEVPSILTKLHPGVPVQTAAGGPAPLLFGVIQNYQQSVIPLAGDAFTVDYTYEPGKPQLVYFLFRSVRYLQAVNKTTLIDALRQKYGQETLANMANHLPTTNAADIVEMSWLFDEKGHVVHPGNPDVNNVPYGCQGDLDANGPGSTYRDMIGEVANAGRQGFQPIPAATFCDSLIVLHMIIDGSGGNGDLVTDTRTVLLDSALRRRSAIAVGTAQRAQAQKQQQNEQNQANQAKPNL